DFQWTAEAEMAFKQMKTLIEELPILTVSKGKEELVSYLAAANEAVSAVLMTEREGKQMPIYFVSRALQGPKINYTPMEKLILALVSASNRLKRYFPAHTIIVITHQPIKQMLSNPEVAERFLKWRFELEEHDIHYRPRTLVKGQILADFIIERPEDDPPDTPIKDKEELLDSWILFIDGSSCIDGSSAGLIITNPKGTKFIYALRLRFRSQSNNSQTRKIRSFDSRPLDSETNRSKKSSRKYALSKMASSSFTHLSKKVLVEELKEKSIDEGEDVQRLNGKLASLNRFLAKSAKKSLPFFKTLKKCTKKSDFQWTAKAETAFKQMKKLIADLPMLTAPKEKEELVIYLVAAKAISAVLMMERDGKQMPIYFMLCNSEDTGRLLKWRFELEEHVIHYRPRTSVKGQILADFIVERPKDDPLDTPMEDKEKLLDPWILFTDGSSCIDGFRAGLIITNPPFYKWGIDIAGPFPESPSKVKFLIVSIDYFTKWIEARPVTTITGAQIKKFVWDNIVCSFGLLGEIISFNEKQFRDNPFKDWCEKLCIRQCFTSIKHSQANGLVERENRSLGVEIKARLDERSKNQLKEISHVLWAHCIMIKSSNGEMPFSLTYGTKAVIPVEIGMQTLGTAKVDMIKNDEALEINLDILEEKREQVAI
nr:reverse transcriptase domain-containing protein [Tanacetum cinerariifolium]